MKKKNGQGFILYNLFLYGWNFAKYFLCVWKNQSILFLGNIFHFVCCKINWLSDSDGNWKSSL
jgi:hypothetical protein